MSSKFLKISFAVGVLAILAFFQAYLFETIPTQKKFTIYRFEIGILLSLVLIPASNFLWKRYVEEVKRALPCCVRLIWQSIFACLLAFVHISPYIQLHVSRDPSVFNMMSGLSIGIYFTLLFMLACTIFMFDLLNRWKLASSFSHHIEIVVALFLTVLLVSCAYVIASRPPTVVRVNVPIQKLPRSLNGLRIALLADIHLGPTVGFTKIQEIVNITNNLSPDIVIIAGDLTDVTVEEGVELALPLKDLHASKGKFFVSGNHEYHTGDVDNWFHLLRKFGFRILHNENAKVYGYRRKLSDWLCLVGVDDFEAHLYGYSNHHMNLTRAYRGCDHCHPTVLVAHQPRAAQLAVNSKFSFDLILSGHTHGGQFNPILSPLYVFNPYFRGLYKQGKTYIYVTQGCAYYAIPLRFWSHTEITHITLRDPMHF